ncbi:MAG: hypothetical protein GY799_26855 [Desulfobulbaceae bacterium]|nr:hypothetical protein [Desulfobulbaceae bacterium]
MKRAQILAELEDLRVLNNWYDIKDVNDIPEMHIQSIQKHFDRLKPEEQRIVWDRILNDYRKPYLPNEQYYKSMVGVYLNEVIPLRKDRSQYDPLTQEEKEEVAKAASDAYMEYSKTMDNTYGVKEEKSNVDARKARILQNVKKGLVEVVDCSLMAERLRNGPIWISKSEAESRGLEYRDHTPDVLGEMGDLGRVGTMNAVKQFRK